jgi:hypothetical protein
LANKPAAPLSANLQSLLRLQQLFGFHRQVPAELGNITDFTNYTTALIHSKQEPDAISQQETLRENESEKETAPTADARSVVAIRDRSPLLSKSDPPKVAPSQATDRNLPSVRGGYRGAMAGGETGGLGGGMASGLGAVVAVERKVKVRLPNGGIVSAFLQKTTTRTINQSFVTNQTRVFITNHHHTSQNGNCAATNFTNVTN